MVTQNSHRRRRYIPRRRSRLLTLIDVRWTRTLVPRRSTAATVHSSTIRLAYRHRCRRPLT